MTKSNAAVPGLLGAAHLHVHGDGTRTPAIVTPPATLPAGQRLAVAEGYDAAARTVELTTATETPVLMPGWAVGLSDCEVYYEILDCSPAAVDLSQVADGNVPVLDTHNRWNLRDRLGTIRQARIEAREVVTVAAFGQSDEARAVEANFAAGTPPKVSVGYRRRQMVLAGMEGDIPIYRVVRWTLTEVSLVSIAADPKAGVRSAQPYQAPAITTEQHMTLSSTSGATASGIVAPPLAAANASRSFIESIGTRGPAPQAGHGQQQAPAQPAPVAPAPAATTELSAAPAPTAPLAVPVATLPATTTEGGRSAAVERFTVSGALGFLEVARSFGETIATRAQELIDQNDRGEISSGAAWDAMRIAARDAQRAAAGGVATGGRSIDVTNDERDRFVAGAVNSIIQRAGMTGMVSEAARAAGATIDLDPGQYRGVRNADLARIVIERSGERVQGHDPDLHVRQAIGMRTGPFQSTSDFAVIMDTALNRILQAAYATQEDTWREFCAVTSVNDFRDNEFLRVGAFGGLDVIPENGEIKNGTIPDGEKERLRAREHGKIFGLSRAAIVNDDLGVFSNMAVKLGRGAKIQIEKDVYALLALNNGLGPKMADGKTLFHADHKNIVAAGGPISIGQFEAMDLLFGDQVDVSGDEVLDLRLHTLLVPRADRGKALIANNAEYDNDGGGKFQLPNRVRGLFNAIVATNRLRDTRRYGFADPSVNPTLMVAFLNGVQEPRVESQDGWRTTGTEWRVLFDYGVGAVDWRTAATDAGK
ncbi:phage major capsid protein [Sphingomonas hankookensis]|uniref:phage major capsid protein n=1 Tax=Sphingomonas hankookensis TaxID=563996 RepID=UPI00234F99D7|nr:Mu-like prophage major head subunit gpT family protein [Sphingomonas hankookensis]WCP71559.1 Mu-like prophage major head subunit gpT family protein [Sphingomonas hankookensis]